MKTIFLIRHAKSSWDLPVKDFDRPLTATGIAKAAKVAEATKEFIRDAKTIWSSPAKRASETAVLFAEHWQMDKNDILFSDRLYTFEERQLEEMVRSCPNHHNKLILFGHNNAITDFVNKFGNIFIDDVPTAGFVSIIFETDDWNAISEGKTDKIIFPRDC